MILNFHNKIINNKDYLNKIIANPNVSTKIEVNKIYFGDNDILLKNMLKQQIMVDCVYIDPPFATNSVFKDKYGNEAYSDKLILDEFLVFFQKKAILAREVLKNNGFFWVHIDQKMSHYLKLVCDEIFGFDNFVADIITARIKKNHTKSNNFNVANDNLLVYRKSQESSLKPIFTENHKAPYWHAFDAKGNGDPKLFDGVLITPPIGTHWRWSQERINESISNGTLRINKKGRPEYLVMSRQQKVDSNWCDIAGYSFKTGYPTEKNVDVLKRVLMSSTKKDDIVLDFFAGSGTTIQAALELERKFIGCDKGEQSIQVMSSRFGKEFVKNL